MGSVTKFRGAKSLTPASEEATYQFERDIHQAIEEAEDAGLCWGMIIATLHQTAYWMHQRVQDEE